MSLLLLTSLWSDWGPLVFVRDSKYGMPLVQSFHLLGLTILLATIVALALRLIGFGRTDYGISWLAKQLRPWTAGALVLVMSSGLLIFLATPGKYVDSHPFRLKMVLLCLALMFHFLVVRRLTGTDSRVHSRRVDVIVACLSLTLWFCVGWAGRAIAFIP